MLGLTQQQMAELIGVTYQQAHKYEKGINRIAAGRLFTIAQALGVDVGYFFDGMDSERVVQADAAAADAARARAQFHQHAQPQAPRGDLQSRPRAANPELIANHETELGLEADAAGPDRRILGLFRPNTLAGAGADGRGQVGAPGKVLPRHGIGQGCAAPCHCPGWSPGAAAT